MTNLKIEQDITGLLVIDPHNDFISEGGKVWDRIKGARQFLRASKRYLCRSEREHPNAGFHREGSAEIRCHATRRGGHCS